MEQTPVDLRASFGIQPEQPKSMTDMIAEKGRRGWERDTRRTRNFFAKVGAFIYGLGEADVQEAIKKDVNEKYEKRKGEFSTGLREFGRQAMDTFNEIANRGSNFINETVGTIGREATRARDNLARAVGADVVAPLITDVLRPVYTNIISTEDDIRRAPGVLLEALGRPLERGSNWLVRIVRDNPVSDLVQTMAESYRRRSKTNEGFARFVIGLDNGIDRTSVALWEMRDMGTQLRNAANEVRSAAQNNWQERSATWRAMGQAAGQLRNQ